MTLTGLGGFVVPVVLPSPAPAVPSSELDDVFVSTSSVTVTAVSPSTWTLSNGYVVDVAALADPPSVDVGTALASVSGIAKSGPAVSVILVTSAGDVTLG